MPMELVNQLLPNALYLVVFFVMLAMAVALLKSKARPIPTKVKHKKSSHIATRNEIRFYEALLEVLPREYVVHSQVSLMALVQPVDYKDNSKTWAKRMDFVITDRTTRVLAVIELDDKSHNSEKAKKRDLYKNNALKGHHTLLRFNTEKVFDRKMIKERLYTETEIQFSR